MDYFSLIRVVFKLFVFSPVILGSLWAHSDSQSLPFTDGCAFKSIKGYLVMDANSGQVVRGREFSDKQLAPASLTKMMTFYVLAQALREGRLTLKDQVTVSEKASKMEGSRMFIAPFSRVTVEELIQGVIVQSGNDASVALAEHLAGSEARFVEGMNQNAETLGMRSTHFENASGFPQPNHYTTPLDMAKLTQAIISQFPEYYHWFSQKSFTYSTICQMNRNRLLWLDASVDGVKTGETKEAGYCLVASAKREGMRLISVVMGAPSKEARSQLSQALLDDGFRLFETKKYLHANQVVLKHWVWQGKRFKVPVGLAEDVYLTLPRGWVEPIEQKIIINKPLIAPLFEKEKVGELHLVSNGECLKKVPLVAMQSVSQGGWLHRTCTQGVLAWVSVETR